MADSTVPGALASDPDRLLSYAEFAEWAGVPERTARSWVASGDGPRAIRLGRHVRIRVADALAWLDTRYVAA
jgi:excisionase family DNA binding protein